MCDDLKNDIVSRDASLPSAPLIAPLSVKKPAQKQKQKSQKDAAPANAKSASFKDLLLKKLTCWRDKQDLTLLEEVPGVPLESWVSSPDIISFPSSLSSAQRKIIHDVAVRLELCHASNGSGEERYVSVSRLAEFLVEHDSTVDSSGKGSKWFNDTVPKLFYAPRELTSYEKRSQKSLLKKSLSFCGIHPDTIVPSPYPCPVVVVAADSKKDGAVLVVEAQHARGGECKLLEDLSQTGEVKTSAEYIDTHALLLESASFLSSCECVAFDAEMHSYRSYNGIVCLLQFTGQRSIATAPVPLATAASPEAVPEVATTATSASSSSSPSASSSSDATIQTQSPPQVERRSFIVDTLALWEHIGVVLGPLFADPKVLKIGHSTLGGDLPSLHRDFGVVVVNHYDTQAGASSLGLKGIGLSSLLERLHCPLHAEIAKSKEVMRSIDWRKRPLSEEMKRYALLDTYYLIDVYYIQAARMTFSSSSSSHHHSSSSSSSAGGGGGSKFSSKREFASVGSIHRKVILKARGEEEEVDDEEDGLEEDDDASPSFDVEDSGEVNNDEEENDGFGHESFEDDDGEGGEEDDEGGLIVWNAGGGDGGYSRGDKGGGGGGNGNGYIDDVLEEDEELGEVEDNEEEGTLGGGGGGGGGGGSSYDDLALELGEGFEDDEDEELWEGWGGGGVAATVAPCASNSDEGRQKSSPSLPLTELPDLSKKASVNTTHAAAGGGSFDVVSPSSTSLSSSSFSSSAARSSDADSTSLASTLSTTKGLLTSRHLTELPRLDSLLNVLAEGQKNAHDKLWQPKKYNPNNYSKDANFASRAKAKKNGQKSWDDKTVFVYRHLHKWRDAQANTRDESVSYICSIPLLLDVAEFMPQTEAALLKIWSPLPASMRIDHISSSGVDGTTTSIPILDAVREALELWTNEEAVKAAKKECLLAETATVLLVKEEPICLHLPIQTTVSAARQADVEEDVFDADSLPLVHTAHWGWGFGWWSRVRRYVSKSSPLLFINLLLLGISVFSHGKGKSSIKDDAARSY